MRRLALYVSELIAGPVGPPKKRVNTSPPLLPADYRLTVDAEFRRKESPLQAELHTNTHSTPPYGFVKRVTAARRSGVAILAAVVVVFLQGASCSNNTDEAGTSGAVRHIKTRSGLKKMLEREDDRLVILDLYADWCAPCRILAPTLNNIAKTHRRRAVVYKVDVDRLPGVARMYGVRGIPHVVFIRDGKTVHHLTGLHPPDAYERAVGRFAP